MPSYDSPKCRTMLLPRIPYGVVSFVAPLADHAEPVGVVDVEERAVLAGDPGERAQVGRVAGDAVHAVHADDARVREVVAKQAVEVVGILERESLHGGAAGPGDLAAVVDRLVRPAVEEDRAAGGEHRDHRHVDVRDGRQHERVLASEELREPALDLLVQHRASQEPRPAGVGAPAAQVLRHGVDDLLVEVEPEVVARREVGEPLVADSDHAAVDLVDDGVGHRIRALQLGQIRTGGQPTIDPPITARSAARPGFAEGVHEEGNRHARAPPLAWKTRIEFSPARGSTMGGPDLPTTRGAPWTSIPRRQRWS